VKSESAHRSGTGAPPRGFRDILPTEARELRAIGHALNGTFASYGYVPLEPPMVEQGDGDGVLAGGRVIRFLDRDGALVALRPDMTTAIARLVAQRYADAAGALRLSYFGPVFREEPAMLGAEREFDQAGVELIGPSGALADAEALALLAESLASAGLTGATIAVGHVGAVRALFADVDDETRDLVMRELRDGDHVGAFRRARAGGMGAAALERARAGLEARGTAVDAVDVDGVAYLREVVGLARELFPGDGRWGVANLSLVPPLPYYTGIVFEALHPYVGFPLAAGGRYDLLLAAFGTARPATGFAINVPRLHLALYGSGWRPNAGEALIRLEPGDAATTARVAASLRRRGLPVAIGEVAETAGLRVVEARVVDSNTVRLADGRTLSIEAIENDTADPR